MNENKKKHIYLTVDTECHDINKLNESIYGKTKRGEYGIEKILQLGVELGIPINVFIDIPECHRYGDEHIKKIVNLVKKYHQPICLHVHPDYILNKEKKHFWEYTKEEQKQILAIALDDYVRFCGKYDKLIFRAGAWGVNSDTYDVLRELVPKDVKIIDLSYIYKSRWRCHLSYEEFGTANTAREFKGIELIPNTTYNGFDFLGRRYAFTLSVPNPNFGEFKKVIDKNKISNITYTMHSWDFIKQWFFRRGIIAGNDVLIRKFKKCVRYAQSNGYEFESLYDYRHIEEPDQFIDLCNTKTGKLWCLWYNYRRFAENGRSFKKYGILYFSQYIIPIMILILLISMAWK